MLDADLMLCATQSESFNVCCQSRTIHQPARRSKRVVAWSLATFREILFCQCHRLSCGLRQRHRPPCPKPPSAKTLTGCFRKTKSGLPGNDWRRRQPLIPCARRMNSDFHSVSLLPLDRMAAMTFRRFFLRRHRPLLLGQKLPDVFRFESSPIETCAFLRQRPGPGRISRWPESRQPIL